ncbi:MAG TPA: hypothetical protein VGO29_08980 [Solirubrobacteraceae bacterium]|jgi:hypothetical protein|nr:hypothetical protein [Solirubrobacteraceae bacterium]
MRIYKLVSTLVLALAFGAIAVATASAAETLWRWLPGSAKETFTGTIETIVITEAKEGTKGGSSVKCAKAEILLTDATLKVSSELLENEAKLALAVLHLTNCKSFGLASNSLGDAKEIVLMHLEIHNCLIKSGDPGLLIKILPVHIEAPATKLLVTLEGSFIGLIKEVAFNKYELNIKQKEGSQEIQKCEGGSADSLTSKIDAEPTRNAGIEAFDFLLEFDKTIDKNGEQLMEN